MQKWENCDQKGLLVRCVCVESCARYRTPTNVCGKYRTPTHQAKHYRLHCSACWRQSAHSWGGGFTNIACKLLRMCSRAGPPSAQWSRGPSLGPDSGADTWITAQRAIWILLFNINSMWKFQLIAMAKDFAWWWWIFPLQAKASLVFEFILTSRQVLSIRSNPYQGPKVVGAKTHQLMKLTLLGVVPSAQCARHPSCGVIGQMRVTKYPSHCYCHHYYRRPIAALCLWSAWIVTLIELFSTVLCMLIWILLLPSLLPSS